MAINRKDFIKKACLTGVCTCGLAPVLLGGQGDTSVNSEDQDSANPNALQQEWIAVLLGNMDSTISESKMRELLKPCALTHYNSIGMDKITGAHAGDMDGFVSYLRSDWDWKADYDREAGIIVCDENKDHCVCPMVNRAKNNGSDAMCYCSEGFIEKMFSAVAARPVRATVDKSILRGDKSCRYIVHL